MKKHAHLREIMIILFMTIISVTRATGGEPQYRLVWEDDFNGTAIDTACWSKIPRGNSDWNRHMSPLDTLYQVRDGNLILRGIVNTHYPSDTSRYLTGGIYTRNKKTINYGKVEIRAKLQGARGAWPAFWMVANNEKWPYGGEIDIMERLNNDTIAYQTIHTYYTHVLGIKDNPRHGGINKIETEEYNTYAVEILPDSLVLSINGNHTLTYPRIDTDKEGQYPFGIPYYLMLDMQIEGSWVGKASPEDYPVEQHIDWVRFYELDSCQQTGNDTVGGQPAVMQKKTKHKIRGQRAGRQ